MICGIPQTVAFNAIFSMISYEPLVLYIGNVGNEGMTIITVKFRSLDSVIRKIWMGE